MSPIRLIALTLLAMTAFASNSLLCRFALKQNGIDAASFTAVRLASGALMLWILVKFRRGIHTGKGSWGSAAALFIYAAGFSFAYVTLPASTGALLLFGAVQMTMIGHGMWNGERLSRSQYAGLIFALGGFFFLFAPGISAPPLAGSLLMVCAGAAWGIYSLRGSAAGDPLIVTSENFMRTVPFAAALFVVMYSGTSLNNNNNGMLAAVLSGAVASGIGYAIWYTVLPGLRSIRAAAVQLSVPVIAALGGIIFLDELVTLRLLSASAAILGGVALVIIERAKPQTGSADVNL